MPSFDTLFNPFTVFDGLATVSVLVGSIIAAGGGLGGGGVFVPLYILFFSLETSRAAALSQATIFGGSIVNLIMNSRQRHPLRKHRPLTDFATLMIFEPMLLIGTDTGVLASVVLPDILVLILLVITLVYACIRTWRKGIRRWKNETQAQRESSAATTSTRNANNEGNDTDNDNDNENNAYAGGSSFQRNQTKNKKKSNKTPKAKYSAIEMGTITEQHNEHHNEHSNSPTHTHSNTNEEHAEHGAHAAHAAHDGDIAVAHAEHYEFNHKIDFNRSKMRLPSYSSLHSLHKCRDNNTDNDMYDEEKSSESDDAAEEEQHNHTHTHTANDPQIAGVRGPQKTTVIHNENSNSNSNSNSNHNGTDLQLIVDDNGNLIEVDTETMPDDEDMDMEMETETMPETRATEETHPPPMDLKSLAIACGQPNELQFKIGNISTADLQCLQQFIVHESRVWRPLIIMVCIWFMAASTSIATAEQISSIASCSALYWGITFLAYPFLVCISLFMTHRESQTYTKKMESNRWLPAEGDIRWGASSFFRLLKYPMIAGFAGGMGGLLGIGGGMIVSPLLMELGVIPRVAAATSAFAVLITSSSATLQFILLGYLEYDYMLWFFCVGVIGTFLGQTVVNYAIKQYGRVSVVIFTVAGIMTIAVVLMAVNGILTLMKGISFEFGSACE